jgi:hypothetical protein
MQKSKIKKQNSIKPQKLRLHKAGVSGMLCDCKYWFHAQYEHDDNKCENCGKRIKA